MADIIIARAGDTLDALLWRERGLGIEDCPRVLEANSGLASLGPMLPAGTRVFVPAAAAAVRSRDVVQLWS